MRNWFKRLFGNPAGFDAAVALLPGSAALAALMRKVDVGLESRDFTTALLACRQVLAADPRNIAALQKAGVALKELGQLREAATALSRSLEIDPKLPYSHYLLGEIAEAEGNAAAAKSSWRRVVEMAPDFDPAYQGICRILFNEGALDEALRIAADGVLHLPQSPDMHFCLGNLQYGKGLFEQAEQAYLHALSLQADRSDILFHLANLQHHMGQWGEAGKHYRRILELDPERVDALINLAINFRAAHDEENAADCLRRALALQPRHAAAHFNLGALLQSQGNSAAAIAHYEEAREVHPEFLACRLNLGMAYHEQRRWDDAVVEFEYILRIEPGHADALGNLALALQARGSHDEAIARYRQALVANPGNHNILINLGVLFGGKECFAEALDCYARALQIAPDAIPAYINMAAVYGLQGRESDSLAACERALQIDPASADARYSRALILLRMGAFEEGWKEYEYRWQRSGATPKPEFPGEEWRGDEDLQGKTILLYGEQGLGDVIQFVRYVEQVAAKGARIVLEVPGPLLPLLKEVKGIDDFAMRHLDGDRPGYDFHCALLSLPAALGSTLATIPAHCPYLQAPAVRTEYWKERLAGQTAPKIGLVWAGNPGHKNDRYRSAKLSDLAPLWSGGKWKFLSLQKEVRAEDGATLTSADAIIDLSSGLTDFAETAAIVSNLDLVLTVDTSLAHLAGALGVPVWIMLPYLPDFRWLMERQDSPWYPTARLFRQHSLGDWRTVVEAIDKALRERFGMEG